MRPLRELPEVPGGEGDPLREEEREATEHPEGMQEAGGDLPGARPARKGADLGYGRGRGLGGACEGRG